MNNKKLQKGQDQFVEEVGYFCEQMGMPKMAGRVLGRLLICDPPHQTMNELADYLEASKGSISTSNKLLINFGMVERFSFPKNRKEYYRLKNNVWPSHFESQIERTLAFKNLIAKGLEILKDAPDHQKIRLREMWEFYAWLEIEMPILFKKWKRRLK